MCAPVAASCEGSTAVAGVVAGGAAAGWTTGTTAIVVGATVGGATVVVGCGSQAIAGPVHVLRGTLGADVGGGGHGSRAVAMSTEDEVVEVEDVEVEDVDVVVDVVSPHGAVAMSRNVTEPAKASPSYQDASTTTVPSAVGVSGREEVA